MSDYDVKLCQRLLYYTPSDLWLTESDQDWHFPLLITLREQGPQKLEEQEHRGLGGEMGKGAQQEERQRENRTIKSTAFSVGFQS